MPPIDRENGMLFHAWKHAAVETLKHESLPWRQELCKLMQEILTGAQQPCTLRAAMATLPLLPL
jgi:hypothetical protein